MTARRHARVIELPTISDFATVPLSTVMTEPVRWLWQPLIPYGKTTLIEGNPGVNKTTLAVALSAYVSTLPDCGNVLFLSAEDSASDALRPRLEAAGADLSRVRVIESDRQLELPRDMADLAKLVRENSVRLVVIDPLTAFFGKEINSHKDQDVRRVFTPLGKLAQETGAAVLVIRHLNKSVDLPAMFRGGGSIGIAAAARSVLLVVEDPNDPAARLLVQTKSNIAPIGHAIRYRAVTAENGAPRIEFLGSVDMSANDALHEDAPISAEAEGLLRELLKNGPVPSAVVKQTILDAMISIPTARRVQKRLGIIARWNDHLRCHAWWFPGKEMPQVATF